METWFVLAVLSAVVSGFGAFANKIVAHRKYNTQLVLIVYSIISLLVFVPLAIYLESLSTLSWSMFGIALVSGFITSYSAQMKIQVLHHIDSTIFLPLFKVVSPLIVIIFGITFFGETFSILEWFGLILGLCVPLLLLSREENARQNNLKAGLVLIAICALLASISASLQKYATDIQPVPFWIISIVAVGILMSSSIQYSIKHRGLIINSLKNQCTKGLLQISLLRSVFAGGGFLLTLLAYTYEGPLGIVYTINSLYIIPSIFLAIIFYNEHWNLRKALAIILSILTLALIK